MSETIHPEGAVLNAALELPADARAAYLDKACAGDSALRGRVEALLQAHEQAEGFLEAPLAHVERNRAVTAALGPAEKAGDCIGPYKLLQQIGEGGCGVVYMAEQKTPIHRRVALKVIKPGMDTKQVIARFEAERQALALMDHPNIAKVLDAGATESGRPYFVMELVRGVKITDFCDEQNLPAEERLRLFIQVCQAIQHAHQKGVIHRDIKPSNILVTINDGVPVPKVIDFGIAKATQGRLTDQTVFTAFEQFIGTPAYMSPEQAVLTSLDVDTRSDIYSLGVLLYELLTGSTPFHPKDLLAAGMDEMRRTIREKEPPKPSTRLSSMAADALTTTAKRRQTEPPKLVHLVRGDLDWIVMKCLEKDRSRRYETVNALARDLERHLKGEPVSARPPSMTYFVFKFARRHRATVLTGAGLVAALVLGLALALYGFAQARKERRLAQEEAASSKAVNEFLANDLLAQASPDLTTNQDVTVREVLDRAARNVAGRFRNEPLVEASIRFTLGRTYLLLDNPSAAELQLQRAAEIRRQILGPEHPAALEARLQLVETHLEQGKRPIELLTNLVQVCKRTQGADAPQTLEATRVLCELFLIGRRPDLADGPVRELLCRLNRLKGSAHPDTLQCMNQLADVYRGSGRPFEALALDEEALQNGRRSLGRGWRLTTLMQNVAADYWTMGDYAKAAELTAEVVRSDQQILGPHHVATKISLGNLAGAYGALGKWGLCLDLCQRLVAETNEWSRWYGAAYVGAVAGLLQTNRQTFEECAGVLLRFAKTTNSVTARMVAEICFLAAEPLPNSQDAFQVSELPPDYEEYIWYYGQIARGMAEYRRGNLYESLKWFEKPRACEWAPAACQAGSFYAMIQYRLGDTNGARAAVSEAGRRLRTYINSGELGGPRDLDLLHPQGPTGIYLRSPELRNNWHEYGRSAVTLSEAERLVLGRNVTPLADSTWLESARVRWGPIRERLLEAARLAGRKEWAAARAQYLAALQRPEFDWETARCVELYLVDKMGAVFLLAEDFDHFRSVCTQDFARLRKYPDGVNAFCLTKVCLAHDWAADDPLQQDALKWSQEARFDRRNLSLLRTMAAYRSGHFAQVAQESTAAKADASVANRGAARLYCAMALARLGLQAEGRRELQAAEQVLAPHLANFTGAPWWDLALCQHALDEARRILAPSTNQLAAERAQAQAP